MLLTTVHDPVHNARMANGTGTKSRGIRLQNDIWERLECEAAGLGMTLHELIRRRLAVPLSVAQRSNKMAENGKNLGFADDDDA